MPLMHCVHWYSEKKNVFSDRPKTAAVCDNDYAKQQEAELSQKSSSSTSSSSSYKDL